MDSSGDGTSKTQSVGAVRVSNNGRLYRGGDNTVTTLSFDARKDDDESTRRTLDNNTTHTTKVWGEEKDSGTSKRTAVA